jgi:hypothetical protein
MVEFLVAIHLALPVTAILLLAVRAERKKMLVEKRKIAQLLVIATRGRRSL